MPGLSSFALSFPLVSRADRRCEQCCCLVLHLFPSQRLPLKEFLSIILAKKDQGPEIEIKHECLLIVSAPSPARCGCHLLPGHVLVAKFRKVGVQASCPRTLSERQDTLPFGGAL